VLGQGVGTTAIGVVLGLLGAIAATNLLESQLFGVGTRDATIYAVVTAVLFAVALLACYIPARRATRVDPMVALREG
jgi:ABC-type antimicrobial peptide transport system permease subunit